MHLQAWYGFVELLVCNNWILCKHAVSSICIAPPQLNSIGAPTRVIGNTAVYNGKRGNAPIQAFVFEATRVPGWWINALGKLLNLRALPNTLSRTLSLSSSGAPRSSSSPIGRRTLIEIRLSRYRPSGSMSFESDPGNSIIDNLGSDLRKYFCRP